MSGVLFHFKTVCEDMERLEVPWALIGALAVGVYGEPRTTRDIDIAVAIDGKEKHQELVNQLVTLGYKNPQLLMHVIPTHTMGTRLQTRSSSSYPVALDLLFSSSGIEKEITSSARKIEILPDMIIPVACRGHLIAMKVLSKDNSERMRDETDLQQLLKGASPEDKKTAKEALDLITSRGFHRGKNLNEEYQASLLRFT